MNNREFGGIALGGRGRPVRPIIAAPQAAVRRGVAVFRGSKTGHGYVIKTLWFSSARYVGQVLIRGRRIDGRGTIELRSGQNARRIFDPGAAAATKSHFLRSWPGGTYVEALGCYGFQVDGRGFSYTIAMEVRVPGK